MDNSEKSAKVQTFISPNSNFCAWITSEVDIKTSLTRIERLGCSHQIDQRKEQIVISEEVLSRLKTFFFQLLIILYTSRDSSLLEMLASKRALYLPEVVSVPKRRPGVQMALNSSEMPDEINNKGYT